MTKTIIRKVLSPQHILPIIALFILVATKSLFVASNWFALIATIFLGISVMSSVHHAEVIAHKIGEGLGTLVLALSVTIIEVGLIVSLMGQNGPESSVLARDTVFAAVMIVTNGIVALCLILGGMKYKEQDFQVQGSKSLMVVLMALSFLVFVLPNYTTSTAGPTYNKAQMIFTGFISLVLYVLFIFFQTKSHKNYFEPPTTLNSSKTNLSHGQISNIDAWLSFISLCTSLIAVIALAKLLSPTIEKGLIFLGAPKSAVGLLIALIVLLPESWSAVSAARANRLQTSLNLAIGSGIASIALTIPTVIFYCLINDVPLTLGLDAKNMSFMFITFMIGTITLGSGKSTLLQGAVHAVILFTFIVMSMIP